MPISASARTMQFSTGRPVEHPVGARAAPKERNRSNACFAFEQDFAGARTETVGRSGFSGQALGNWSASRTIATRWVARASRRATAGSAPRRGSWRFRRASGPQEGIAKFRAVAREGSLGVETVVKDAVRPSRGGGVRAAMVRSRPRRVVNDRRAE